MRSFLTVLVFVFPLCCYAQKHSIANANYTQKATYQLDSVNLWLEMSFGKPTVLNAETLNTTQLEKRSISHIDLVYSDYPKDQQFLRLNTQRLEKLFELFPMLESVPNLNLRLVKQTACNNKLEAEKLPHGIAIYFMPEEVKPIVTEEVNDEEKQPIVISTINITAKEIGSDSTVIKFFERNGKFKDSVVIITDLTYSMAPFTWQILQWQQQIAQSNRILAHVFFNDGGKTPDKDKVLGKTGGIYPTTTSRLDSLVSLMDYVQKMGDGGDIPENDLEVLLFAINKYPDAKEYVIIADAKSKIRDWVLLDKLDKPIKIILARTTESYYSIPVQYVQLAMVTSGSLHTLHHDFTTKNSLQNLFNYHEKVKEDYENAAKKKKSKRN